MIVTNPYLQIELKQIQNRNKFFKQTLIESKQYLKNLTDSQAEYLCLYPNKILELDTIKDGFKWILNKSLEYNKLFPLENINLKLIYTSFICLRNKWIKYNLAEWSENEKRFIIPNKTIQFISIYNTEEELIKNVYLNQGFFNYTYEFNRNRAKVIKDSDLYSEWYNLYTNSQAYSYLISNYNINK